MMDPVFETPAGDARWVLYLRSLGLGLPGVRRLMDDFEIVSEQGKGTIVTVKNGNCKYDGAGLGGGLASSQRTI